MPHVTILAKFRDDIRTRAMALKASDILKECDALRDDVLPFLGVRLEDREGTFLIFPSKSDLIYIIFKVKQLLLN